MLGGNIKGVGGLAINEFGSPTSEDLRDIVSFPLTITPTGVFATMVNATGEINLNYNSIFNVSQQINTEMESSQKVYTIIEYSLER